MDLIIVVSAMLKIVYAGLAVGAWWLTVRLINRSTNTDVRAAQALIASSPVALAIYRGGLLFSAAVIIAAAIG